MTVTTGSFPKLLTPGVRAMFDGIVSDESLIWKQIYTILPSEKKYEEVISTYGFGLVPEKAEGAQMVYDNMSQGLVIRHEHKEYCLGCIITKIAKDDNLYMNPAEKAVKNLGMSHNTTSEYVHSIPFTKGFTVPYAHQQGGDGKTLFASDHISRNGTFSNLLTAATFSRTALEDAIIQISRIKDETGVHFSGLKEKLLIGPKALMFEFMEVLKSTYQPDTANNAVNTVMGLMPYVCSPYLDDTSTTAWFIQTNAPEGFVHYERDPMFTRQVNDDDTMNMKIQSYARYVNGVIDPRSCFGNAGI